MTPLSANLVLCETVLWETAKGGGQLASAIRVMGAIDLAPTATSAHFYAVTFLTCQPGDFAQHGLTVKATDKTGMTVIQAATEWKFNFGYILDPSGPGSFILATEFNINVTSHQLPLGCLVSAFMDNQLVARAPLMLRRGQ